MTASAVSYSQTFQPQDQLSRPPVRRGSLGDRECLTPNIILTTPFGAIEEERSSSNNYCMNLTKGYVIVK